MIMLWKEFDEYFYFEKSTLLQGTTKKSFCVISAVVFF